MHANERQVGGYHYNKFGAFQHWDMVHHFKLDYYQGQITKYVMRWKDKNGVPDLEKARHFLDKYIELQGREGIQEELLPHPKEPVLPEFAKVVYDMFETRTDFTTEGYYADMTQDYKCKKCGARYRTRTMEQAADEHGTCPGRTYVQSDPYTIELFEKLG